MPNKLGEFQTMEIIQYFLDHHASDNLLLADELKAILGQIQICHDQIEVLIKIQKAALDCESGYHIPAEGAEMSIAREGIKLEAQFAKLHALVFQAHDINMKNGATYKF